jgi:hypothetical protein
MSRGGPNRVALWTTLAWIGLIVSGALTTGLLRAPVSHPSVVPFAYQSHRFAGTLVGVLGLTQLIHPARRNGQNWFGAALIGGTVALGWLGAASLEPRAVVAHAFMAAVATVSLSSVASVAPESPLSAARPRARWITVSAQLAVGLVSAQVAVGAMLRHQQIGLTSHLVVGGLAVVVLLAPAVAILQDEAARAVERRVARWAITAVVFQVALGVAVLLMILIGPPSVTAWLAATVAHVTVGTLTLVAAARFLFTLSWRW